MFVLSSYYNNVYYRSWSTCVVGVVVPQSHSPACIVR